MKQKKKRGQKKKASRAAAAQGLRKFTGPMKGLYKVRESKNMVLNTQVRDSGSKVIFDNHTLCSQLLRDYVDLPCLKHVRPEDIESFRRLPGEEIEAILRDSPDGLVDTIADVLRAFLLKMNVPVPETEKLTDKVREKKMGELFADMEKMDIQAERKNTADARKEADEERRRADEEQKRADEAEKHAQKAQQRADEEQQRADEEQKRADEEQKRADEAEKHVQEAQRRADEAEENSIKSIIELCQDLGMSKNSTMAKLMEKLHLSPEESQKKAGLYWKE